MALSGWLPRWEIARRQRILQDNPAAALVHWPHHAPLPTGYNPTPLEQERRLRALLSITQQ